MEHRPRLLAASLALTSLVALAACGDGSNAAARSTDTEEPRVTAHPAITGHWTRGYPNSIAVLGHSGSTGENSDPDQPGVEVRENSWATGTNPQVRSVYLRVLAENSKIEGNAWAYSQAGASVGDVAVQADQMLAEEPAPALILIQVMDNDMTCPLEPSALEEFEGQLTQVLDGIARRTTRSRMFLVSQFGSPENMELMFSRKELRQMGGGTGPCDFIGADGRLVREKVDTLNTAIHAYERALGTACGSVDRCTYDGGAFGAIVDQAEWWSSDVSHLSVAGHAKAAEVAWDALVATGVLPAP